MSMLQLLWDGGSKRYAKLVGNWYPYVYSPDRKVRQACVGYDKTLITWSFGDVPKYFVQLQGSRNFTGQNETFHTQHLV